MQQQHQAGTKLEKAELLEMTVDYVCRVQEDVSQKMSLGYASCMREVDTFLSQTGTGSEVDSQLRAHLIRRLSRSRRHLGSVTHTGSRCRAEDQPSSSSTFSTSSCGLLPRKLCFDDSQQVRGTALRDMNDNARYAQLTSRSDDLYRRAATLTTGSENIDLLFGHQLDVATAVGVDSISSTTSTSVPQGRSKERSERPMYSDVGNSEAAASDYSVSSRRADVANVKCEVFTPVWRPW